MRNYPSLVTLHEKAKIIFLGFSCGPVVGTSGPGWELVLEMKNQFSDSVFCFRIRSRKKTCLVPSHKGINVQNHTKRILSLNMSRSAEALKWFPRSEFSPEAFFACFLDCPPTPENNGTLNTTGLLRDFEARPAKTWPRNEE